MNEGWQATAEASATAGKGGSGSQTNFVNGMAVYQLDTKGLMAERRHIRDEVLEGRRPQLMNRPTDGHPEMAGEVNDDVEPPRLA